MEPISKSVKRKDHDLKMSGRALYVDDIKVDGMLHGRLLRSTKARASIKEIQLPSLPEGYYIVDRHDVPGVNRVAIVDNDTPVFAEDQVKYVSEPILMVVGPDLRVIDRILKEIVVCYEEESPVLDMCESATVFYSYHYDKGDVDKAFTEADRIIEESFHTGYQEQAYLEPQGAFASYKDGKVTVHGSMQCPYYVHGAVVKALGCEAGQVQIIQEVTGGGFGGKEDYPSILACQVAVAARKIGKPVKVILERREDISTTSKRHPAFMTYRTAIKNNGITGMEADIIFNSGAYTTLSPVVLQRGMLSATGVYKIDNLRVLGRAVMTNTVPNGAYRGFGAPQTFFAVEMHMDHIAKELGIDSLKLKEQYLVKQGDDTATSGKYHFPVLLPEMIEKIDGMCDFRAKRKTYRNQTGRYRKGIGLSLFYHGCGFTGNGERDLIKAVARLAKREDDTVDILVSNTDMGQGVKTTFSKIVADVLEIPLDRIHMENPDTDKVPDSGPTVASRSIMTVGKLLERAAKKMKGNWKPGTYQCFEEHFVPPDFVIPFDLNTFQGDAYPTYSWAVNAIEVRVDTLTAITDIVGAWGVFDVGVPIDDNVIQGQMQGGFLQGIGYGSMELMEANEKGVIRNDSFTDYIIPTSMDVPVLKTATVNNPYVDGPYGAKGAGELPLVGAAPAYVEAIENALGTNLYKAPFLPEDTMKVLEGLR